MIQNTSINPPTCSICLCQLEYQVQVLGKCGHTFHSYCLTSDMFKTTKCPNCRAKIKHKKNMQIFELAIPQQGKTQSEKNRLTIVYSRLKEVELFLGRIMKRYDHLTNENQQAKIFKVHRFTILQSVQLNLKGLISKHEFNEYEFVKRIMKTDEQVQTVKNQICRSWNGFQQIKNRLNISFKARNQRHKEKIKFLLAMQQYEIAWLKAQLQN
ncbi:hypothetical protein pb186bvf_013005 [Paramecium bursaria]